MDGASDALLSLRPVTFRYKPELDPQGIPQFGLIAEEVAKIAPRTSWCATTRARSIPCATKR